MSVHDIPLLSPDAMSVEDAITLFAEATDTLPVVPLVWCLANWGQAGPPLVTLIERYADGSDRSDRSASAMAFCIFLAAGAREKRAFAPLCLLARDAEAMEDALGDAVTESFQNILISTFDGNLGLLKGLIEDSSVDDFIRSAALRTFAYLAAANEIDRPEAESYLAALSDGLDAVPGEFVWSEWAEVIALLGLEQFKPLISAAINDGRITPDIADSAHYKRVFATASGRDDPLTVFNENNIRVITDVGAEFEGWYCFSEQRRRDDREQALRAQKPSSLFNPRIPAVNQHRSVGRNDPCPCGSGKKFKKCCLN